MSARGRAHRLAVVAGGQPAWLAWVQRRLGTTPTGLVVLALAGAGATAGRVLSSRTMFVLVYGALAVVVVGRLLNRRQLAIDVRRSKIPLRMREGQRVEVELELTAKRRVSTILVEEVLHSNLGGSVRVPIPLLPAGEVCRHEYSFAPRLRGVYKVGPLVASWSDPFGVNQQSTVLAEPIEVLVHPSTELVHDRVVTREWEDPPVRPPSSRPWPTGFEFYGVRDYVDGDDPRRIVWRATARTLDADNGTGRYLVRESEQGITDRVDLILDTERSRHSPGDVSVSFEAAVRVCASLGARHLDDGFSVTLDANSGALAKGLRGRRSRIDLLDSLARVERERATLDDAVDRVLTGRRTVHNVLVTPSIAHDTASRLRLLRERGVSMLVVIVHWDGTDPASVKRAAAIGCNIVEVHPGAPLELMFQHLASGSRQ